MLIIGGYYTNKKLLNTCCVLNLDLIFNCINSHNISVVYL